MAGVSVTIITLLVVASFSLRASESLPSGCKKMVGFLEEGIPGEYIVKMSRSVKANDVMQMMLELTVSGCEGKVYRTSDAPDASTYPITCSKMVYIDAFGFAAKMSDAAVMWLCDKESVEYIEPSYPVTLPTQPPATIAPDDDAGSGPSNELIPDNIEPTTTADAVAATVTNDLTGKVTPATSDVTQQVTVTTTPMVSMAQKCDKLHGELSSVNNYLIMLQYDLPPPRMNDLYDLLNCVKQVDSNFEMNKMKPIFKGPVKGFYYNGLNEEAIMKLCESDLVDYIQVKEEEEEEEASSTVVPQPTTTPVLCNKMIEYEDKTNIIPDSYILMLHKSTTNAYIQSLVQLLESFIHHAGSSFVTVKKVIPAENMKMIMVEINQAGLEWICQNPHVEKIDYDKEASIPPVPPAEPEEPNHNIRPKCTKLKGIIPESGTIPCRIYMTKANNKADCSKFIKRMSAKDKDSKNGIQFTVTRVSHHKKRPMIKAMLNLEAMNLACQSDDVESIISM